MKERIVLMAIDRGAGAWISYWADTDALIVGPEAGFTGRECYNETLARLGDTQAVICTAPGMEEIE
jgi:hypothetical protein